MREMMQSTKRFILATAVVFVTGIAAPASDQGNKAGGVISPKALDALYSTYIEIQQALAGDNLEAAQKQSQAFLKQPIQFPVNLSQSVKAKEILGDFTAMNIATDIATYRKAFSPLSDHMVLVISEVKYKGEKSVLEFHCPMANNNQGGKWLQIGTGVANPYFGSAMLTCGTLTKRLQEGRSNEKSASPEKKPTGKRETKEKTNVKPTGNDHGTHH